MLYYACTHGWLAGQRLPRFRPAMKMESVSVCLRGGPRFTVEMHGWSKTVFRCPCIPLSTVEMFGGIISASTGSDKEIAGLLKKMMTRNREIACEWILVCQVSLVPTIPDPSFCAHA